MSEFISPTPGINGPSSVAGSNIVLCDQENALFSLSGNSVAGGFKGTWTYTGPSLLAIADVNDASSSVTGNLVPGTYIFTWTITGPCHKSVSSFTLTVDDCCTDCEMELDIDYCVTGCEVCITPNLSLGPCTTFDTYKIAWGDGWLEHKRTPGCHKYNSPGLRTFTLTAYGRGPNGPCDVTVVKQIEVGECPSTCDCEGNSATISLKGMSPWGICAVDFEAIPNLSPCSSLEGATWYFINPNGGISGSSNPAGGPLLANMPLVDNGGTYQICVDIYTKANGKRCTTQVCTSFYFAPCTPSMGAKSKVKNNATNLNSRAQETDAASSRDLVNPLNVELKISARPNPVTDFLYLNLESELEGDLSLEIRDQNGKIVHQESGINKETKALSREINVQGWSSGVYIIRAVQADKQQAVRVIKIK